MKKTILFVLVLALGLIAPVANADFTFGTLKNLPSHLEGEPSISGDGLTLYFNSNMPGGYGNWDLWMTTRPTKGCSWGPPENLGPSLNTAMGEGGPSISADGLSLYFHSNRPLGTSTVDIWVSTRATTDDDWRPAVNLGPIVNSSPWDLEPSISADGLSLFFTSFRLGGYGNTDIWVTTRETTNDRWGPPVNLGPNVNSSRYEWGPSISFDNLILIFESDPGGVGTNDLWFTTRRTKNDTWGRPVNLGPNVNSSYLEFDPCLSMDGLCLYFNSNRPSVSGGGNLWQVDVIPIVDFNGDGVVDCEDLCVMVNNWDHSFSLCDIGPTPFGDGIVDAQDLEVLMSYWGQEVYDPTLIAHWALDETEGDIAYDSAGEHNGTLQGDPAWQPTAGQIDGALAFDGNDDYVSTPFVLNPADGALSVFAWIKGSTPGQIIVSQAGGADWLSADSSEGKLITGLSKPAGGRFPPQPLVSDFIITDGQWHRIGFVWDVSNRILYVDDVEVAEDTQTGLAGSNGGLYIGAGKSLEAGSFFSGLIDDVRVYNRAVTP